MLKRVAIPSDDDTTVDVLKSQIAMRDQAIEELRKELAQTRAERDQALADVIRWTARVKTVESRLEEIRSICDRSGS